ncbi:TonB family protein [Hymenobacter monticola]|uniref:TonB family protein n=1 Tax=Hymenobacter monticola TaxID=1705399 RepID=A0ABY4B1M2_9BACT|nr:energy transducer TonB [Hymenobacter monticola]UOE33019.1 TonB family protein [Hymenobacter monticola]
MSSYSQFAVLKALIALAAAEASAQQPAIPDLKTEYLDSARAVLPTAQGARYRRETEYADSVQAAVKTYALATGKLTSSQMYGHLRKGLLSGVWEEWYPSGQLESHAEYLHGRRTGEMRTYYPSGQLKRREVYNQKNDFKTSGECFAENGLPVPFFPFEQMPVYPEGDGGPRAVIKAVVRGMVYPKLTRKDHCEGQVVVGFNVNAAGEVADVQLKQGLCPLADEAVLASVRKLKRFQPGRRDGVPMPVAYTLPVTFANE